MHVKLQEHLRSNCLVGLAIHCRLCCRLSLTKMSCTDVIAAASNALNFYNFNLCSASFQS